MVIGPGNLYVLILKLFDLTVVGKKERKKERKKAAISGFLIWAQCNNQDVLTIQCSREREKKQDCECA